VAGTIRSVAVRKWFWVAGSIAQGLAVVAMDIVALFLRGVAAGWSSLALLAVFSLARGVCSVAAKDVLGKTISKSRRGSVTGYASSIAGAVSFIVALCALAVRPGEQSMILFVSLLLIADGLRIVAALAFSHFHEFPGSTEFGGYVITEAVSQMRLFRD